MGHQKLIMGVITKRRKVYACGLNNIEQKVLSRCSEKLLKR